MVQSKTPSRIDDVLNFLFEFQNEFPYPDFGTVRKMDVAGKLAIARIRIGSLLKDPDAKPDAENALEALKPCMQDIERGEQARLRFHLKNVVHHVARIKAGENIRKRIKERELKDADTEEISER